MKTCPKCHIEKDASEYYHDSRRRDRLSTYCKSCNAAKSRLYWASMTQEARDKYNETCRKYARGDGVRASSTGKMPPGEVRAIKSSRGCLRCGESDSYALDFHHVKDKVADIRNGSAINRATLLSEISKCVVLCSNCHRKLHAELWSLLDFSAKIESDYPEAYALIAS